MLMELFLQTEAKVSRLKGTQTDPWGMGVGSPGKNSWTVELRWLSITKHTIHPTFSKKKTEKDESLPSDAAATQEIKAGSKWLLEEVTAAREPKPRGRAWASMVVLPTSMQQILKAQPLYWCSKPPVEGGTDSSQERRCSSRPGTHRQGCPSAVH